MTLVEKMKELLSLKRAVDAELKIEPSPDREMEELYESLRGGTFLQKTYFAQNCSPAALIVSDDPNDPFAIADIGRLTDVYAPRTHLPSINNFKLTVSVIWNLCKDMIGKDLTRHSTPVFINEPMSVTQKLCAESAYIIAQGAIKAT